MRKTDSENPTANHAVSGHLALLDWIRFSAALLVVLCHARPDHWVAWSDLDTEGRTWVAKLFFLGIRPGPEAVIIFFVLSGYLVGGKVIQRCLQATFSPADYFIDRASRIFIPLVPALLLTLGCVWFVQHKLPPDYWLSLAGNILQMQGILCDRIEGNPPLWSLSYEVWFYLLAGSLAVVCGRLKNPPSPVIRVIMAVLALFSCWCLSVLNTSYLFCWLIGALAYVSPAKNPSRNSALAGITLAMIGLGICQATGAYQGGLIMSSELIYKAGILLIGASTAFLLALLAGSGRRLSGAATAVWGTRLAAFSYTLYLTHYPLLIVLKSYHLPYTSFSSVSVLLYFFKIGVSLLVAWLIYLPFERNTGRVRQRLHSVFNQVKPNKDRPTSSL